MLIYEYGKNHGLSFQVVDDILDFTQSAELPGKPAGSDLAKGNLTAPVQRNNRPYLEGTISHTLLPISLTEPVI